VAGGSLIRPVAATAAGLHDLGGPAGLDGRSLVALAVDTEALWAADRGGSILRSENGEWQDVASLPDPAPRCLLSTDDGLLIGTAHARLFRLVRGAVEPVEAFDHVPGRDGWYTPWGGPPDTRSLAIGSTGAVYANVHVGGIVRSVPGGAWEPTIDVDTDVHQVSTARPGPLVLAATAYGLARSDDGGDTWDITDDGLHGSYCRAVAVAGETVLVSASTGPFTRQAAVYRRPLDGGGPFERCGGGLPEWFPSNIDTACLAADEHRVVLGTAEGEVWTSEDGGSTWERAAEGLPKITAVVFAPGTPEDRRGRASNHP
jgi:hypothetical protein